jgi:hypothetical protein
MVQYLKSFRKGTAVEPKHLEDLEPTTYDAWLASTAPSFRTFPTEIRLLIFHQYLRHYLLQERLEGLTPPLIKALRSDPQVYQEALEIFYSLKTCSISPKNEARIVHLPLSVLRRVVSVKLWYG